MGTELATLGQDEVAETPTYSYLDSAVSVINVTIHQDNYRAINSIIMIIIGFFLIALYKRFVCKLNTCT